jgi:hypothetical protein
MESYTRAKSAFPDQFTVKGRAYHRREVVFDRSSLMGSLVLWGRWRLATIVEEYLLGI